ncbi:class I SAM-dependent methyltransferase, partial [Phytoactinopolyspora endophytica]|uniref:class I SAM-dependent methyltransferase n=1 Tax=Phytoactinopolyspora endophytica TaxID=1642495 RepID=UPI00197C638E
ALLRLAERYPRSTFVGIDSFEGQLERARANAEASGLSDRVTFERGDVAVDGLPARYDIVSTFDVVHDSADPLGLMHAIRKGLNSDGIYLLLEINAADEPADNVGPLATFFYGASLLYCMTTSLADGGAGLGTCGMPESRVREFGTKAGFQRVKRAPITENPFNVLYELRP